MARRTLRLCLECGTELAQPSPSQKTCEGVCRETRYARNQARWRGDNKDHITRYAADRYAANPAHQLAVSNDWRARNPVKVRAMGRRYYARHAEECKATSKAYFQANPGVGDFHRDRMRSRIRKAKVIFDRLAEVNPAVYEAIADVKDKGRAMIRALKTMGIEVSA